MFRTFRDAFLTRLTHAAAERLELTKLLILQFAFCFTHSCLRTPAGTPDTRADLQYSHISSVCPSWLLFSLSVFAGRLQSGVIAVRGYTDAFCCVLCSSSVDLLVTGAYGAGAPPAGLKRKMRRVCWSHTERLLLLKSLRTKPGEHQFDPRHNYSQVYGVNFQTSGDY